MPNTAISFPKDAEFFDVEGVPVVLTRPPCKIPFAMAYNPGKRPRPFSFESVMRNGAQISELRFREIAALPAMRPARPSRRDLYRASIKRVTPILARSLYEASVHMLANLRSSTYNDGIPMLLDDDPVYWDHVGADAADVMAAAAIARAALP